MFLDLERRTLDGGFLLGLGHFGGLVLFEGRALRTLTSFAAWCLGFLHHDEGEARSETRSNLSGRLNS